MWPDETVDTSAVDEQIRRMTDDSSALQSQSVTGNFWSGAMQSLSALGLGYISRRADVDIQTRLATAGSSQIGGKNSPITTPFGTNDFTQNGQRQAGAGSALRLSPTMMVGGLVLVVGLVVLLRR